MRIQTIEIINYKDFTLREAVVETLKTPYVLEFLGLPQSSALLESQLEAAIITNLQAFLLELGKGFAVVARKKRLRFIQIATEYHPRVYTAKTG